MNDSMQILSYKSTLARQSQRLDVGLKLGVVEVMLFFIELVEQGCSTGLWFSFIESLKRLRNDLVNRR